MQADGLGGTRALAIAPAARPNTLDRTRIFAVRPLPPGGRAVRVACVDGERDALTTLVATGALAAGGAAIASAATGSSSSPGRRSVPRDRRGRPPQLVGGGA